MKRQLFGFSLLLALTTLVLAQGGPSIVHTPVATAVSGQAISIQMSTSVPASDITNAIVAYRRPGEDAYHEADMLASGNVFRGEIPASVVTERGIEYYLSITMKNGNREYLPPSSGGAPSGPFVVSVRSEGSAPAGTVMFQLVSPDPEEPQSTSEDVIVSIAIIGGELDAATARLEVDGAAVTKWANLTPELVSYIAKDLRSGTHTIRINGNTKTSLTIPQLVSSFKAVAPGEVERARTPFAFHGNAWEETRYEDVATLPGQANSKNSWQREGMDFNGRYGKLDYGGRFYISNEEKSDEQPRDRYQIWMGMRWWKLGLGDNQPDYTPLTVSGKRVRGVMFELNAGKFHLDGATGQTDRALPNYTNGETAYRQELSTVRNWYGTQDGSHFGLTFVKTQDIRSSLDSKLADSVSHVMPVENIVFGTDLQLAFDKRRILLGGEFAASLFNRNTGPGALTKKDFDSLPGSPSVPFDPKSFENFFVLNQNMAPLDPTKKTNLAYTANASLNYFNNFLLFRFRSTGPSFYSLGSPSIIQDDKGINISDRVRLMDSRLFLTLGYETAQNNLDNNSLNGTVKQGTVNFDISYFPKEDYLPAASLSYRDGSRKNDISTFDSVTDNRVNEKLKTTSFYIAKTFHMLDYDHGVSLTINNFTRDDQYTRTLGSPNASNSSMLNLNWKTNWQPDLFTTITISNMKVGNPGTDGAGHYVNQSTTYGTYGIRGDKSWMQNRLQAFLGLNSQSTTGQTKFNKLNYTLGGAYQFQYQFTARAEMDFYSTKFDYSNGSSTANEKFMWLRLEKMF